LLAFPALAIAEVILEEWFSLKVRGRMWEDVSGDGLDENLF